MNQNREDESEHGQQQQPQQQSAAEDDEEGCDDEYLVSCRCESAKAVSTLLSCLKHIASSGPAGEGSSKEKSNMCSGTQQSRRRSAASSLQPVTVFCSPTSLTFHVYGKSKQMQASVDMQSSLFSDYSVSSTAPATTTTTTAGDHDRQPKEDWQAGGEFCVNLSTVLECLHCLGTHNLDKTKLCFSYNTTKEIFKMELLEESGVLSTAAIPGMLPPDDDLGSDSLALAFRSSPIAARIIVKSETLQELVSELELVAGGTTATVSLGGDGLEMNVVGHLGECKIVLPARGDHVVSVELPPAATTATSLSAARAYPLHALTESMRGLQIAEETCITINSAGMMAIQHQVLDRTLSDAPSFVDFILCCMMPEDDDDDENYKGATTAVSQESTSPRSLAWSQTQDGAASVTTRPTARVVSQKKMFPCADRGDNDDDDDDSKTDDSSRFPPSASHARLFGSVVAADESQQSSSRASSRKVVRRRARRPLRKRSRAVATSKSSNNSDSDVSRNLLGDSDDEDEHMEETEPLDVTVLASPSCRRDYREDECSSPELVYGQQR